MMLSDVRLSVMYMWAAEWLIVPSSVGLAQGCCCALPLQAWVGHIVAASRLQLVNCKFLVPTHSG